MRKKLLLASHLVGAVIFLCGVAMIYVPASLILAGGLLMAAAITARP
jgi:hypothetical protein